MFYFLNAINQRISASRFGEMLYFCFIVLIDQSMSVTSNDHASTACLKPLNALSSNGFVQKFGKSGKTLSSSVSTDVFLATSFDHGFRSFTLSVSGSSPVEI